MGHDAVVEALLEVLQPRDGEIRLLGRVHDARIGNPSDREVYLFVPDLHLVSPARRLHFGHYGFNHENSGLLVALLERLALLREEWERQDERKLITVQVGDFIDLWREFPDHADFDTIADDMHGALRDGLYRGIVRGMPCLRATMLLGNHDTKHGQALEEIDFRLKAFNRDANGEPFLFMTHGDAFDILEKVADDGIQEFIVNFVGKLTPSNTYTVGHYGSLAAQHVNKPLSGLQQSIMASDHALPEVTGAVKVLPGLPLPPLAAKLIDRPEDEPQDRFNDFYKALGDAADTHPTTRRVSVIAVGHSHHAALILHAPQPPGRFLCLMDNGAWIEHCTYQLAEGGEVTEPSAQLGVIHGNDVRIYQIRVGVA